MSQHVESPLVLFKQFNAAFTETLEASSGANMVEQLLYFAHETFERHVSQSACGTEAVACRGGCASCCSIRVAVTAPEVLLISQYLGVLRKLRGPTFVHDLVARIEKTNEATNGAGEMDRMDAAELCPFIEDGFCMIYAYRPLACRGHASFSEHACMEALSGEEVEVPISEPHLMARSLIQNAMQSALRDAGLGWGMYEFNQALVIALSEDNVQDAWFEGEDVFAPAFIADVSPEEMAETFDAIKAAA